MKRSASYTRTPIGLVPSDWRLCKLGTVIERVGRPIQVEPSRSYVQIGIRSHGKGIFHKDPVNGVELGSKSVFWIEPDRLVLNIVFGWEQAVARTTDKEIGTIGSHRFPMYRPKVDDTETPLVDIDYVLAYLLTKRGTEILQESSPGGAGRNKTLGQELFLSHFIPIPPLSEQRRMASILSAIDKVIIGKEKLLEAKKTRKRALMQKLLNPGTNGDMVVSSIAPSTRGRRAAFQSSPDWESCRISDCAEVRSGGTPATDTPRYWGGGIPWVTPSEISKAGKYLETTVTSISEEGLDNSSAELLPIGTVVMCSRATIGPRAILKVPMATNQGFKNFVCKDNLDPEFWYYYLEEVVPSFMSYASGNTFKEVSKTDVEKTVIRLPSLSEQRRIAAILSVADREIDGHVREIDAWKEKRKALSQLLLSGKVRV